MGLLRDGDFRVLPSLNFRDIDNMFFFFPGRICNVYLSCRGLCAEEGTWSSLGECFLERFIRISP